ncbi:histidine kinase [Elizabethkingia meningoseptica]|uniref:histidine kinase n=2 Tax=Elizabethkingia meningoseptica TaxID=238 RepID=UPI0023B179EA|nr:histidine kinase [Elizabethkingia meningoseptica]MDE5493344.1 histidine kinase [Elizabethkingia meningoseptica]
MKIKELFFFGLIAVVILAGGFYFYKSWKFKQDLQEVAPGSLVFIETVGFSGGQAQKVYKSAYRIDKIIQDTIFANPVNTITEIPYSVIDDESYSLLKDKGREIKINALSSDRGFFETKKLTVDQAEDMFPVLKQSPFYYFKNETEKFIKRDFVSESVLKRWTNEPSVNNNFTNKYYPEGSVKGIDAFIK